MLVGRMLLINAATTSYSLYISELMHFLDRMNWRDVNSADDAGRYAGVPVLRKKIPPRMPVGAYPRKRPYSVDVWPQRPVLSY